MYFQRRVSYFCIIYTLVSYPIVYKYIIHTELNLFPAVTSTVALTSRSTVVRLRDFSRVGSFLSALQHIFCCWKFVRSLFTHFYRALLCRTRCFTFASANTQAIRFYVWILPKIRDRCVFSNARVFRNQAAFTRR